MFKKILIANRGEIACRIARTARRMGIQVATVHSSVDEQALHVREIGESVWIGEGPARQSYLDIDAVIDAAQAVKADAIHPGFGFLSENPELARRCAESGIVFIGPASSTLELFGDKAAAKRLAHQLGIPTAGGMLEPSDDIDAIMAAIEDITLPCIVKAVAGGGGKGMRVIRSLEQARDAIAEASREGRSSFGDGRLIAERYLDRPRHVEVQILGDGRGGVVHLYDRECSLQRRHQKVVEEAPVASVPDELRRSLWSHAVAMGQAVNYLGLGTVEFAVTGNEAVFLEVNPRLQVEHPVTECITGLDLVELQMRVVFDRKLPLLQSDVPAVDGHAIQARLYAEDPERGFLPSTGLIREFRPAEQIRTDTGVAAGSDISPHYDPMIAKLIAHGKTRPEALTHLKQALSEVSILGVSNNRSFLLALLDDPQVYINNVDTETIDRWLEEKAGSKTDPAHVAVVMALWCLKSIQDRRASGAWGDADLMGWRMRRSGDDAVDVGDITLRYEARTSSESWRIGFGTHVREGVWAVRVDDELFSVQVSELCDNHREELRPVGRSFSATMQGRLRRRIDFASLDLAVNGEACALARGHAVKVDGRSLSVEFACEPDRIWAAVGAVGIVADVASLHERKGGSGGPGQDGSVYAPMMGMIVALHVEQGGKVRAGDRLATLESMKMEMALTAETDGAVAWIGCAAGAKVERSQELFRIEPVKEEVEA